MQTQKLDTPTSHQPPGTVNATHLVSGVNELVHATRTERRAHGLHHGLARVDVADQLRFPLARVRALLEQNNLRLLLSFDAHTIRRVSNTYATYTHVFPSSSSALARCTSAAAHHHHGCWRSCIARPSGQRRFITTEKQAKSWLLPPSPHPIGGQGSAPRWHKRIQNRTYEYTQCA